MTLCLLAPPVRTGEGRVYVYQGSLAGLGIDPATTLSNSVSGSFFGGSVSFAKTIYGPQSDGIPYYDVIVGAPHYTYNGLNNAGAAFTYRGSSSGLGTSYTDRIVGLDPQANAQLGFSVAGGDLNSDDKGDVIIGDPYVSYGNGAVQNGLVYVYYGGTSLSAGERVQFGYINYTRKTKDVFRCPADRYISPEQRAVGWTERVRSIAMNFWVGYDGSGGEDPPPQQEYRRYFKETDFRKLSPANAWVFIDFHPDDVLTGGLFALGPQTPIIAAGKADWGMMPASYHDGGCGLGFADGHAVRKQWELAQTRQPVRFLADNGNLVQVNKTSPDGRDYMWLWERATESNK